MANTPVEPTNLVLEQLRVMRAETNARFDSVDAKIARIETDLRGLKPNTIAEIYKANLTVASFADHERRIHAARKPDFAL